MEEQIERKIKTAIATAEIIQIFGITLAGYLSKTNKFDFDKETAWELKEMLGKATTKIESLIIGIDYLITKRNLLLDEPDDSDDVYLD